MKITLCGSIAFYDEMAKLKNELESQGHEIKLPPIEVKDGTGKLISVKDYYTIRKNETKDTSWVWDRKEEAMRIHFNKIRWSDAILVTNYEKNGIQGYVGANTLMEMGVAFHLKKQIFMLNQIPEMNCKEEILGMKPVLIKGNINKIGD